MIAFKIFQTNCGTLRFDQGNKALDATVNEVYNYIYQPDGKIKFKLGFDEQAEELPRRSKVISEEIIYPALYSGQLKIKASKFQDLQALKSVIHKDAHPFYDTLPHH